ncbi:MAG: CPBP family glutamic-type intramembrane protease, partial [Gemmatimonadota bacterium]|nr:CPBP family glutamic-type intramembrane protease [Gemmatimonadota bacterium]
LLVVGAAVWLATLVSVTRPSDVGLGRLALEVALIAVASVLGTLVAEDGFFRGTLWGALERAGRPDDAILLWTSTANALWFAPLLLLEPALGGSPEAASVHLLNIWLLAMSWGVLRLVSGSVLVAAWAHGLWNGLAYALFGFGPSSGALALVDPLRFDPERGWAGVAFNAAAFLVLWRWWQRREAAAAEAEADAVSEPS